MAMDKNGLTKLVEECGELIAVAAKKQAYMDTDLHPDGSNLKGRMEEEIADVLAAIKFVECQFRLDTMAIDSRMMEKFRLYEKWDKEQ